MRLPNLETWKLTFASRFMTDWHPKHWITQEGKESLVSRVNTCKTWDEIRKVAPYTYTPDTVREFWKQNPANP